MSILVISGHPHLDQSVSNAAILKNLEHHFGDRLKVRDLGAHYPDYRIDVKAEQKALVDADIIVLQFPIYWYTMPALLKKWFDDVFQYGFAYGSTGTALRGKKLILSVTAGASQTTYRRDALNQELPDFLLTFHGTAVFTGMELHEPIYSYAMPTATTDPHVVARVTRDHSDRLIAQVEKLAVAASLAA